MKKIYFALIFSSLSLLTVAQIPTNGLVVYYPFNGNPNDQSGNANNGTVTGASLTTDKNGNPNSAYSFNGTGDNIMSAFAPLTSPPFSISAWVNLTALSPNFIQNILTLGASGANLNTLYFGAYPSNGRIGIGTAGANDITSTNGLFSPGIWQHVVVVCSSYGVGQTTFYINGTAFTNNTTGGANIPVPFNNTAFMVGGQSGGGYWTGKLDEIAIYNRTLTQNEVQQLYLANCNITSNIKAFGPTSFCAGSNVLLVAPASYSAYQWKKNGTNISGATNSTYTATATGTYKCVLTCNSSTAISNGIAVTSLSNTSNSITSSGSAAFCAGDSLMLSSTNSSSGYTYQWYRSNISIPGAVAKNYTAKNPGVYKVISTNPINGCSRISNNSITAVVNCRMSNPGMLSGPVDNEVKQLHLFPNPNNGSFTLEYTDEEIADGAANIEIRNTLGQIIYHTNGEFINNQLNYVIKLDNDLQKGIYLVNINIHGKVVTSRVLLQ